VSQRAPAALEHGLGADPEEEEPPERLAPARVAPAGRRRIHAPILALAGEKQPVRRRYRAFPAPVSNVVYRNSHHMKRRVTNRVSIERPGGLS
jgi:hypothetical protein